MTLTLPLAIPIPDSYWVIPWRLLDGEYPDHKDDAQALVKLRHFCENDFGCRISFMRTVLVPDPQDPGSVLLAHAAHPSPEDRSPSGREGVAEGPIPIPPGREAGGMLWLRSPGLLSTRPGNRRDGLVAAPTGRPNYPPEGIEALGNSCPARSSHATACPNLRSPAGRRAGHRCPR